LKDKVAVEGVVVGLALKHVAHFFRPNAFDDET
jgi:hypothetical protein